MQIAEGQAWTPERINVVVNTMHLRQLLGMPLLISAGEALQHAGTCLAYYQQWLPVIQAASRTDIGVGEDVVAMAVSALVVAFSHTQDMMHLIEVRITPAGQGVACQHSKPLCLCAGRILHSFYSMRGDALANSPQPTWYQQIYRTWHLPGCTLTAHGQP